LTASRSPAILDTGTKLLGGVVGGSKDLKVGCGWSRRAAD